MIRHVAVGSVAFVLVGALAGCGGGSSSTYSLAKSRACFTGKGFQAQAVVNRSLPGSGGDLRIAMGPKFGMEYVFLVFGRNASEATATENHAVDLTEKTFAQRQLVMPRSAVLAGVEVIKNVFFYSNSGPISQDVRNDIQQCLR